MAGSGRGIEFVTLRVDAEVRDNGHLGDFAGTTIRGAFGLALRGLCCHTRGARCDDCALRHNCAYGVIFEGVPPPGRKVMRKYPRVPQPFLLIVPPGVRLPLQSGNRFGFGVRLFGPALSMYPYVVQAVVHMLERGLGRERARLDLLEVSDGSSVVFRAGARTVKPVSRCWLAVPRLPEAPVRAVEVSFETPLRMQLSGRMVTQPALGAILRAAVRRVRLLVSLYGRGGVPPVPGGLLDAAAAAEVLHVELSRHGVKRFSGRQGRSMVMDGIVGRIRYRWPEGVPGPQGWLEAASVLHIGKGATFGFGRISYRVEEA